jgi:hypothetical protein
VEHEAQIKAPMIEDDEMEIVEVDTYKAGEDLPEPVLRPGNILTGGAFDAMGNSCMALILQPGGPGSNIETPMTVLVPLDRVETVIKMLRMSQAVMPTNRKSMA